MPAGSVSGSSSHPGPEESPESTSFFRDATLVLDSPARYPPVPRCRSPIEIPGDSLCFVPSSFSLFANATDSIDSCVSTCLPLRERYRAAGGLARSRPWTHIFVLMDASWSVLSGLDVRSIFINFAPFPVSRQVCGRRRRERKKNKRGKHETNTRR